MKIRIKMWLDTYKNEETEFIAEIDNKLLEGQSSKRKRFIIENCVYNTITYAFEYTWEKINKGEKYDK